MKGQSAAPRTTDVRALIREQIDNADEFTVAAISDRILKVLTIEQRKEALAHALPLLVRDVAMSTRPGRRNAAASRRPQSAKVSARREWWRQQIESVYSTGAVMKRLGDFTADELEALTGTAREMAASNAAAAERFEKLHAAMGETGATKVRDLDEAILRDVFDGDPR